MPPAMPPLERPTTQWPALRRPITHARYVVTPQDLAGLYGAQEAFSERVLAELDFVRLELHAAVRLVTLVCVVFLAVAAVAMGLSLAALTMH